MIVVKHMIDHLEIYITFYFNFWNPNVLYEYYGWRDIYRSILLESYILKKYMTCWVLIANAIIKRGKCRKRQFFNVNAIQGFSIRYNDHSRT